jgi:4-aminobutyrate aminotransferase
MGTEDRELEGIAVKTLPGKRAKKILDMDRQYLSPSLTRHYPLVVARGKGAYVEDVDGNVFLDFTAGIAVCSTGHCHPEVVKAIKKQAETLIHMSGTDFYYEPQVLLAKKLVEIAPFEGGRVFLCNSGTEAVECAFKLARYHTRRPNIIAFYGAFHGRTMGSLSLTASRAVQRKHFSPLISGVFHVPYAYCYRCAYGKEYPECDFECVSFIKFLLNKVSPSEDTSAIIVEPVQGEGGYVIPPPEFLPMLREICDELNLLLIVDEVQSGMGRTGKMFAVEHFNVKPDILAIAKGIASGLPLGACIAREEVMNWETGSHASTFGGNPVACAAALRTIQILEEGLIRNAQTIGKYLIKRLNELQTTFSIIGDVRGLGLMVGVELVRDDKNPASEAVKDVINYCFRNGLLLLPAGESVIRFMPPLIIKKDEVDTAIDIFYQALNNLRR